MGNTDEKLCGLCNVRKIWAKGFCGACYKKQVRAGKLDIKKRGTSPSTLTQLQRDVLTASMLGDGFLSGRYKNAVLRINRSRKDKEYLLWEFEIFKDFCDSPAREYSRFHKKQQKTYHSSFFETRASSAFNEFREKWYINGIKDVPPDLELSPLIIAIWLCDDGCFLFRDGRPYRIKFATCAFSKEATTTLAEKLSAFVDADFTIQKHEGGYSIVGSVVAARKLLLLIKDFIPSSMKRKIEKWVIR